MTGARLHFIVEGQTEESFIKRVMVPHLAARSVWGTVRCVMTSRRRGIVHRGGLSRYALAKKDIELWMKEDRGLDAAFTTMFDLYALPEDFPEHEKSRKIADPFQRVKALEKAFLEDMNDPRFIPYIQIHEFEALIFADPRKLDWEFPNRGKAISNLERVASEFQSPELIDDGAETAPSKRIIRELPDYRGMKVSAGSLTVEKIGLESLRSKCEHFGEWVGNLEILAGS